MILRSIIFETVFIIARALDTRDSMNGFTISASHNFILKYIQVFVTHARWINNPTPAEKANLANCMIIELHQYFRLQLRYNLYCSELILIDEVGADFRAKQEREY